MSGEMLIVQVAAAALLYLIAKNRLHAFAHPLRMRLADLGSAALKNDRLTEQVRRRIAFQMDNAYNSRIAWAFVVMLPFAAINSLWTSFAGRDASDGTKADDKAKSDETAIMVLSTVSVFATSPVAAALFAIEAAFFALLFIPLGSAIRSMERTLEAAEGQIQSRHHHAAGH